MSPHDVDAVAVIGFGNQGRAQAQNLRDAGRRVVVGARPGGRSDAEARAMGFAVAEPVDVAREAGTIAMLLPDEVLPALWPALASAAPRGAMMVFAHGFNLLDGGLAMPDGVDVVLVSPTGPGAVLRETAARGGKLPCYLAVHRDASGRAEARGRDYAGAVGCAPVWPTTVREETEVDLFGEQVVLCGGLQALVRGAFDTLVRHGYAPEIAYLECVHQLKYLADLLHSRGPAGFREQISGTARFGDVTRGPRIIGPGSLAEMERVLDEIRSGRFAAEWRAEVAAGRPRLSAQARFDREAPIEAARRRALGPGGDPGGPPPGDESRNA